MTKDDQKWQDRSFRLMSWIGRQMAFLGVLVLIGAAGIYGQVEREAGLIGASVMALACGFFLMVWTQRQARRVRDERVLRQRYPDQPWRWRNEWINRSVTIDPWPMTGVAWLIVLGWNGAMWPLAFELYDPDLDLPAVLLIGIWPAIGIAGLVAAVRMTRNGLRFGKTHLDLGELPFKRGGLLSATLRARQCFQAQDQLCANLNCSVTRRVSTGKGSSTRSTTLFATRQLLPWSSARPEGRRGALPLRFVIPSDAADSGPREQGDRISWTLSVSGPRGFYVEAEVPVFGLADQQVAEGINPVTTAYDVEPLAEAKRMALLSAAGVSITDEAGDLYRIEIPAMAAATRRGMLVSGLVFALAAVASWLLFSIGILSLIILLFALVQLGYLAYGLFGRRQLVIQGCSIQLVSQFLTFEVSQCWDRQDVVEVHAFPDSVVPSAVASARREQLREHVNHGGHWQVLLATHQEELASLAHGLPDRRTATALAQLVSGALEQSGGPVGATDGRIEAA